MDRTKQQIEAAEDNWNVFASSAGWRCSVCGCVPTYSERNAFLRTKMCDVCATNAQQQTPEPPRDDLHR